MCGVAEAGLALAVVSAVTGFVGSRNAANAQIAQNQKTDAVLYEGYKGQLRSIDRKRTQERRKIGAKAFELQVETAQTQGRTRAELDQMGFGQFGLDGRSPDAIMNDIQFRKGIAGARLQQYETDMIAETTQDKEFAYLNYAAGNASLTPVSSPSLIELGIDIAEAGFNYSENPNRRNFNSPSTGSRAYAAPGPFGYQSAGTQAPYGL